jgi:PKD repeat protein
VYKRQVIYNTPGTYDVSLTVTNSAGSNSITKTGYITVTQNTVTYCTSKGTNTSKEWINSISLGSYTNNSGSNAGYGNFIATIVPLPAGNAYSLALVPGFSGKSRSEYWRVWIDFNKDGDFLDNGETVYSGNAKKTSVTGTITIPSGLTGQTRMRISMKYNAAPTSCETFTYGEVEDYTVSFDAPPQAPVVNQSENTVISPAIVAPTSTLRLEIYPNPATELLNVMVSGAAETFNLKVYNALGQVIDDFDVKSNRTTINLNSYKKGLYYIGVDDGMHTALKKFIK